MNCVKGSYLHHTVGLGPVGPTTLKLTELLHQFPQFNLHPRQFNDSIGHLEVSHLDTVRLGIESFVKCLFTCELARLSSLVALYRVTASYR